MLHITPVINDTGEPARKYVSDGSDDSDVPDYDSDFEPPTFVLGPRKNVWMHHNDTGYVDWAPEVAQKPQLCYELAWAAKGEHPEYDTPAKMMKALEKEMVPEYLRQSDGWVRDNDGPYAMPHCVSKFLTDAVCDSFIEWLASLDSKSVTASLYGKAVTIAICLNLARKKRIDGAVDAFAKHQKVNLHPGLDVCKLWSASPRRSIKFDEKIFKLYRTLLDKIDARFPEAAERAYASHRAKMAAKHEKERDETLQARKRQRRAEDEDDE